MASRITFSRQLAQGNDFLIGQLVAAAVYKIMAQNVADGYDATGQVARAQQLRRRLAAVDALKGTTPIFAQPEQSMLTMLLPSHAIKNLQHGDLLPLAQVEHTALEEAALGVLLVVLLIVLLVRVFTALGYWLALRREDVVPLLLLPDGKALLRILLPGVLAPACAYLAITHWLHPAWRAAGIMRTGGYTLLALLAFALVLTILPEMLARGYLRRRCYQLGMLPAKGAAGRQRCAWYRGTLTQSLLPINAAIIIFLGGLFYPYLVGQEQRWIAQDKVLFWHGTTMHAFAFGPLEDQAGHAHADRHAAGAGKG